MCFLRTRTYFLNSSHPARSTSRKKAANPSSGWLHIDRSVGLSHYIKQQRSGNRSHWLYRGRRMAWRPAIDDNCSLASFVPRTRTKRTSFLLALSLSLSLPLGAFVVRGTLSSMKGKSVHKRREGGGREKGLTADKFLVLPLLADSASFGSFVRSSITTHISTEPIFQSLAVLQLPSRCANNVLLLLRA